MIESIIIPAPKFDQGQDIWALFQGHAHPLRVTTRLFNPDTRCWYYKLSETQLLFIENDLSPRERDTELGSPDDSTDELTDETFF